MRLPGVLLAALLLIPALSGCASTPTPAGGEPSSPATSATLPTFQATDINGELFDFGEHLGTKAVLMSFWAMWCEPCKAEMPFLQALHQKYADKGLLVLSVSMDGPDTQGSVAPYIYSNGYEFTCVMDEDSAITQAYNPKAVAPFSVFIDAEGRHVRNVEGFQLSEAAAIEAEVVHLLGL